MIRLSDRGRPRRRPDGAGAARGDVRRRRARRLGGRRSRRRSRCASVRPGRRPDGPRDARPRRDRGDAAHRCGPPRGRRGRADVLLRPGADPAGARRRRRRLPAQGRGAGGAREGGPGCRPRRGAARSTRGSRAPARSEHRVAPRGAVGAGARGAGPGRARPPEQAHRAGARDQREDRQGAPHSGLPRDRRHRPDAGGALGGAERARGS